MQTKRELAIALSSRGFGFACLEGKDRLLDYGNKNIYKQFKNAWLLSKATRLIERNAPDALVLQDISAKDKSRSKRIKELHRQLIAVAKERKIKVVKFTGKKLRVVLLNDELATKHEMSKRLAMLFPDELSTRLPPKRKAWMNEHPQMDMFDAVGLAVAHQLEMVSGNLITRNRCDEIDVLE